MAKIDKTFGKTKAERVFSEIRFQCWKHIETWGYEVNPSGKAVGFNRVHSDEEVCTRTLNALEKLSQQQRNFWQRCLKTGVIDKAKYAEEIKVLNMVDSTIENTRNR